MLGKKEGVVVWFNRNVKVGQRKASGVDFLCEATVLKQLIFRFMDFL